MSVNNIDRIESTKQPELKYSCGAGFANVNLYTGRMYFVHADISMGYSNYQTEISHIYNSKFSIKNGIETNMGSKWKLNVEQYLYYENGKYIYIDASGFHHEFSRLREKEYYDTLGKGLILKTNTGYEEITDKALNRMIFVSNRLIKYISCEHPEMVKYYDYINGKLARVYDGRKSENKFEFSYSNNLLKTITFIKSSKIIEVIEYFYNSDNELIKITRTRENITKIDSIYSYSNGNLINATCFEDYSTLKFNYSYKMISSVTAGKAKIIAESIDQPDEYLSSGLYCGDDKYLSESSMIVEYVHEDEIEVYSQNIIEYLDMITIVSNEKNLKMVYYLNKNGLISSVFEANNGNINDLRTPKKLPGIMLSNNVSPPAINQKRLFKFYTNTILKPDDILVGNLNKINDYRKLKCTNYINFNLSFFLKINQKMSDSKINIYINSSNFEHGLDYGIGSFDNTAVGSWQYVSIPITILSAKINSMLISFADSSNNTYYISDMRFCYSPSDKLYLTNESTYKPQIDLMKTPLDMVNKIEYVTTTGSQTINRNIDEDFYVSSTDLQETYLSMFKENGNSFIMSLCDNTKKIAVDSVKLITTQSEFPLNFVFDENGVRSRAKFLYEITSPDGDLHTFGTPYFYRNKKFGNKYYNCMLQISEVYKTNDKGEVVNKSETSTAVDFRGKILQETDEYGIQTLYEYDDYGSQSSKTIQNIDKQGTEFEKIVTTTIENKERQYIEYKDYKSKVRVDYNSKSENVNSISYNGINDYESNSLNEYFTYDRFDSKIMSLNNYSNGINYMNYGGGKLYEVTPIGWENDNAYGYKFSYTDYGDPYKYYLTYKEGNKKVEELLQKKNIDRKNGIITTEQYREINSDKTILTLDKYGRTTSVYQDGNTTTFKRQILSESSGASEVTEMYDPIEKRTYEYSYDDNNNLTGYKIKNNDNIFLAVESSGNNRTKYSGMNQPFVHSSEITYDDNKLINPRITKSKGLIAEETKQQDEANAIVVDETAYDYDYLGRVDHKEHKVFDGVLGSYTSISEDFKYKTNTPLKEKIVVNIDNPSSKDTTYEMDYIYNGLGNITISTLTQNTDGKPTHLEHYIYEYDNAGRLISESSSTSSGLPRTYTYNRDGSIDTTTFDSYKTKYEYQKGRLINFYNVLNPNTKINFSYDNLGNCTHYKTPKTNSPNLKWERGNLLKEYNNGEINATYSYNSQGVRFKKQLSSNKSSTYFLDGDKILGEKFNDGKTIIYIYDAEGLKGFKTINKQHPYHYVKDATGNIIAILDENIEVAHYTYDAWGKCVITKDIDGIGTLNPFRWKAQYYDNESGFYYIDGRYYAPEIMQYICGQSIGNALTNANTIFGLNLYLLTKQNPVNLFYNGYNINTSIPLTYSPPKLSKFKYFFGVAWPNFWRSSKGSWLAVGLFIVALVLSFNPATLGILASFKVLVSTSLLLITGAIISGFSSKYNGNSFGEAFVDYITDNWAQSLAITSAVFIVCAGINLVKQATPKCFKAGTKILTSTGYKEIENIKVGDKVLSFDEETGEQSFKEVVRLFRNSTSSWSTTFVKVDGSDDISEITSTPGHKYYLPFNDENRNLNEQLEHASYEGLGVKWVSAQDLKSGDKVLLSSGKYGIIIKVETKELDEPETTYNFEVGDFHTYYVGEASVCVHNANCGAPDLYRGGNKMNVRGRDVEIVDGLVQPTQGISVNSNPSAVMNFGQAHKIGTLPDGLQIIYTGGTHYVIAPSYAMPLGQYQNLLYQIPLTPFG